MSGAIRLVAGGLLALIACYAGVLVKRHYKERERFFRSALDYSRFLKSELAFKKTPIPEIASKFAANKKGDFERALLSCVEKMSRGGDVGDIALAHLKQGERTELVSYLSGFGKSSLNEQLALAAQLENYALKKSQECEKETSRLGGMYFKLCVLLGLAILLILA